MASKRKLLLISEKAEKMTRKFVALPLTELRHNFCSFSLIFFNFVHFTMPRGEHISLGDKGRIVALWQEGKSNHAIAKQFGLHHSMVGIFLKKFELLKVWKNITPAYLRSLYESMPRRMRAVVEANSGHTKY